MIWLLDVVTGAAACAYFHTWCPPSCADFHARHVEAKPTALDSALTALDMLEIV